MIEFRCQQCGKGLQVADDSAGSEGKCVSCGADVRIPRPVGAPGIWIQEAGLGAPIGIRAEEEEPATPPGAASRFALAEAYCRIWRAGELPPHDNPEHKVADVSRTGLKVILARKAKRRTLAHVQKAPWKVGDQVEVDLKAGAFVKPIRVSAEVMRVEGLGLGKGTELGLRITRADEEAARRLELLETREDLRQRRTRGTFGH